MNDPLWEQDIDSILDFQDDQFLNTNNFDLDTLDTTDNDMSPLHEGNYEHHSPGGDEHRGGESEGQLNQYHNVEYADFVAGGHGDQGEVVEGEYSVSYEDFTGYIEEIYGEMNSNSEFLNNILSQQKVALKAPTEENIFNVSVMHNFLEEKLNSQISTLDYIYDNYIIDLHHLHQLYYTRKELLIQMDHLILLKQELSNNSIRKAYLIKSITYVIDY
mgnify:CR=1 FL=1